MNVRVTGLKFKESLSHFAGKCSAFSRYACLLCFVSTWMHMRNLAPLKFSSSLRCFARVLPVGLFVKKNVVCENVCENLLVKFLHSSFTPQKSVRASRHQFPFLAFFCLVQVKPIIRLVTLTMSKPALFSALVHVPVCSQFLRLTTAQFFLHFLLWPNNFCALCIHCFFTVKIKIIKKQTLPPSFKWIPKGAGRQTTCRFFPQIPTSGGKESTDLWPWERESSECVSNMHLVCPLAFFPTSPLRIRSFPTRQAAALAYFGLFTVLSKLKPRLAQHQNLSKKIYRRVHHGPQTYHSCDQTTLQTKWGRMTCEGDIGPTSFSFSRTEKKKQLSYFFTMECGGGKTPWKIWRTAICERWTSSPREKARKVVVHVHWLEREREPWVCVIWDMYKQVLLQSRDCTTVSMYGINSAR